MEAGTVDTGKQKKLVLGNLEDGNLKTGKIKERKLRRRKLIKRKPRNGRREWGAGTGGR
jgi:hypothetical protein